MSEEYIRVWQSHDIKYIHDHLIIVGDLTSDCAKCKALGLDYTQANTCPECKTAFNYVATRKTGSSRFNIIRRVREKRTDLTFIDYDDYKSLIGKAQAKDFLFKDPS